MDFKIKRLDEVITADGESLGLALRIFTNPDKDDVNPKLKLFEHYLEVSNSDLGDTFFIPTDFIAEYKADSGKVMLSISMRTIGGETLTREPAFIALGRAERKDLE